MTYYAVVKTTKKKFKTIYFHLWFAVFRTQSPVDYRNAVV